MKERKICFSTVKLGRRNVTLCFITLFVAQIKGTSASVVFPEDTRGQSSVCCMSSDIAVSGKLCIPLESSGRIRVGFGYILSFSVM